MAVPLLSGILSATSPARPHLPAIIAHRGASHAAPENTIAAMERAWKEGADGVEGDFHLTRDGEVVCIHDPDTLRTTGVMKVVSQSTWAELEPLDAGSWKSPEFRAERIPRLSEMLDHLPSGKRFFIEIKSGPATLEPIKRILESHPTKVDPKAVIIISFDAKVVAESRRLMPGFQAHLITSLDDFGHPAAMERLDETLTLSAATGLQFKLLPALTVEWIEGLKKRGLLTDCWVVNEVEHAVKLAKAGVEYLTSDRPGPLREELEARLGDG